MRDVIELSEFTSRACREFGSDGVDRIINYFSKNPKSGKVIDRLGGIRKLAWQQSGKKGAEFFVYFHPGNKRLPLVLICLRKKGEQQVSDKIIEQLLHNKIY